MLPSNSLALLALFAPDLVASTDKHHEDPDHGDVIETTVCETSIWEPTCTASVTVFETTIIPKTSYHEVIVDLTSTDTVVEEITESITTTLLFTVNITETETDWTTITFTNSTTITETDSTTVTDTDSVTVTETDTDTTTNTVPATVTTYTTKTVISTEVDPCPTTCKVAVDTVNLYFWPSDRPYTYPSTHYDEVLDYTFTSPSVYMLIPTASGTNSLGPAGPATTSWILALDLEEVSTIVDGTITSQLDLADLGTDCPKSRNPTEIATLVDSACAPILAAPTAVSSWASPCNACGKFGLFDPPYAVPTLPGGLLGTTTVIETAIETTSAEETTAPESTAADPTTAEETTEPEITVADPTTVITSSSLPPPPPLPSSTSVLESGVIVVVYLSDGEAVSTDTIETSGLMGTLTSFVEDGAEPTSPNISIPGSLSGSGTAQTDNPTGSGPTSPPDSAAANFVVGPVQLLFVVLVIMLML